MAIRGYSKRERERDLDGVCQAVKSFPDAALILITYI